MKSIRLKIAIACFVLAFCIASGSCSIQTASDPTPYNGHETTAAQASYRPPLQIPIITAVDPKPEPQAPVEPEAVPEMIDDVALMSDLDVEPEPESQPEPIVIPELSEAEALCLAKVVWGEAGGCTTTEQAAVIWCIFNHVDSEDPYYPDDIIGAVTQPGAFYGYNANHPVKENILELVYDVYTRWQYEKAGEENVGRILPAEYLWFNGDGVHNYFRDGYKGNYNIWDWSLESPYEN